MSCTGVTVFSCAICFRVCFTVVSEPPEDDMDGECEDVGVATVSIRDILKNKQDLMDADVPRELNYGG